MAMRMAVIALKNAADARMNTSSIIRSIHSIRSRKVISDFSMLFLVVVPGFSPAVAATFAHLNRIASVIRSVPAGTWIFPERFVESERSLAIGQDQKNSNTKSQVKNRMEK